MSLEDRLAAELVRSQLFIEVIKPWAYKAAVRQLNENISGYMVPEEAKVKEAADILWLLTSWEEEMN
jgi:hypothetical protein